MMAMPDSDDGDDYRSDGGDIFVLTVMAMMVTTTLIIGMMMAITLLLSMIVMMTMV